MPADILISKLENIKGWFVYFISALAFAFTFAFAYRVNKFSTQNDAHNMNEHCTGRQAGRQPNRKASKRA